MPNPSPLLIRGRDPLAALLAEQDDSASAEWFARSGLSALRRFVQSLAARREVKSAKLTAATARRGGTHVHDLHLEFVVRPGRKLVAHGSGAAPTPLDAKLAALGELFERMAFQSQWLLEYGLVGRAVQSASSNGACFHTSAARVLRGAICELLERDAFLTNWYSDRPLPVTRIEVLHPLFSVGERLAAEGWELFEHHWPHDLLPAHCVSIALVRREHLADGWNLFVGGGSAPSYDAARARALAEAEWLRGAWPGMFEQVDTSGGRAPNSKLRSVTARTIAFQRRYYVDRYRARLAKPTAQVSVPDSPLSDRSFVVECLRQMPSLRFESLPLPIALVPHAYCVQAGSAQLQNIDWELPASYNERRIRQKYGTKRGSFCLVPHPIG